MTRLMYEKELELLKTNLEEMARYVENAINRISEAIETGNMELAENIIKNDRSVNDMERSIESKCLSIITRQQPIAGDLRMVSAALKVVTDLERIGDHAADIAELLMRCDGVDVKHFSKHLMPMIEASKKMVKDSVTTFLNSDTTMAQFVIDSDDIVDDLFNAVKLDIITALKNGEKNIDNCVDILMLAKYLEKIGDHAVNIAEWEVFRETGIIRNVRLL